MTEDIGPLRNPHFDGSAFFWPRGEIAILCLHGFTATTVEVRQIAAYFSDQGYTTRGPLLPGHGTSAMEMNHTTWRDWLSAAENTLLELMDTYDKVFILGESMGGLLTLYLAAQYPSLLGAMVFAPAIKIRNLWLTKFIWRFKPLIKKGKPNPQIPQQSYASFPLRAAASLLDLQRIVKNHLKKIKIPVIIFQGKLDDTIDPMGALYAYEYIRHEDKDFVYLEESSHIILLDKQLPVVQQICHDFILARLP